MTLSRADLEAAGAGSRAGQATRRVFTAEYKLAMVAEYDRQTASGAKGALLRREGLYSSHIIEWRRARDAGMLPGMTDQSSKRPSMSGKSTKTPQQRENERLARQNARLEAELERTKAALEIMGKTHALLQLLGKGADPDERPSE